MNRVRPVEIVILGAGPCGLGAGHRLEELRLETAGAVNYKLVDESDRPGGQAASVRTQEGFTFDFGGHVLFPHKEFEKFSAILATLPIEWSRSCPRRGTWWNGGIIPFPVQRNIHRLGSREALSVLVGLIEARRSHPNVQSKSLLTYLEGTFGLPLTRLLLGPLNKKMWATDLSEISSSWVHHRSGSRLPNVPDVGVARLVLNTLCRRDDPSWGPASTVAYPAAGGTGAIWNAIAEELNPSSLSLRRKVATIDATRRAIIFDDNTVLPYDAIISSIPIDILTKLIIGRADLARLASRLRFLRTRTFGYGIEGMLPKFLKGIHSFLVPDSHIPYWRVTIPSNTAPGNVPDASKHYSLLFEVNERPAAMADPKLGDLVCQQARQMKLIERGRIVSTWERTLEHGYPVPTKDRDEVLHELNSELLTLGIASRGRFGGWKYEVSNQDHAFAQGQEAVDFLIGGVPERTYFTRYS